MATCDISQAYLSIVITVLPQWAIITTLIVTILLAFHSSLKAARIYDNCTKITAKYKYYVEIRTGDTSGTYIRRRTTIYIDMFDENQTTLARVAIPGHIIFGKKDAPITPLEDEKYFELRVTRFWLYRATKLKNIQTIRLTHTCMEQDARIMVYGIEIRSSESDKCKFFFPIMSNISPYGTFNRPNISFDVESTGSISNMGGLQSETSAISSLLSWTDLTIITYLTAAVAFCVSSSDIISASFDSLAPCFGKGAIVGLISYLVAILVGLTMRYYIKHYYALRIGVGRWAIAYYTVCTLIVLTAAAIWIYTTIYAYKSMCPSAFGFWVLAAMIGLSECGLFVFITSLISWAISLLNARTGEQYILPDDAASSGQEMSSKRITKQTMTHGMPATAQWPTLPGQIPMQLVMPPPNYLPFNQMMLNPLPQGYKTIHGYTIAGYDTHNPPYANPIPTSANPAALYGPKTANLSPAGLPTVPLPLPGAGQTNLHGIKPSKKVGSVESTGSDYYQQVMRNKGGVKSISQYGELLKQKKRPQK